MEKEDDYLTLSVEDRCQHKLWKARLSGYEDASKLFLQMDDENSSELQKYSGMLRNFISDSNALAQEKGLCAVLAYVEHSGYASKTARDVMSAIIGKCFFSTRAKTKELALEIALMYIEIGKQDSVSDELIKGLENKSPRIVAACIATLREALHLFGSKIIATKPLLKVLPRLLDDRDKNVRKESKLLYVEIYRWVGEAIKPFLQCIKPVTLVELEGEFQKTAEESAAVIRHLRFREGKNSKIEDEEESTIKSDDANAVDCARSQVDSYDLMTPVDILSKLPQNFYEKCKDEKWKERKEILEALLHLTTNIKLEAGAYGDLIRALKELITRDTNVVVVALAAKCLTNIVLGLRKNFRPYVTACTAAILEKFKEKKQNVVAALREAIDALYGVSSLEDMLHNIQTALDTKNPEVKAKTCSFLTRCFCSCSPNQLNTKILKALTSSLLKTLNDTDSTVRELSAEALGTALKVVGEKAMSSFLQEIDAFKMAKVREFSEKAVVTIKLRPQSADKKRDSVPETLDIAGLPGNAVQSEMVADENEVLTCIAKPKSASALLKTVRYVDLNNDISGESDEPEKEPGGGVGIQESELLTHDVVSGVCSSNWKERLAALKKLFWTLKTMEKSSISSQNLIKFLGRKQGFKDNNFQVLNLRLEILAYIAENCHTSRTSIESCLIDVVNKIGDAKIGVFARSALSAFAEATSLEYVSLKVLNLAFSKRNSQNQSEAILWVSQAIKQFGLKVNVKEVIGYTKRALSSTNPVVRSSGLTLVGAMYMYVGQNLRLLFEDEKPSLLQQIDFEFAKMKDVNTNQTEKGDGINRSESYVSVDERPDKETQGVDLSPMPRVDISSQITQKLLSELTDKDWHLRCEALQKLSVIISDAKFVEPNLGDLPSVLKLRLVDTNKKLTIQALNICQMLGESLGPHCSKQIRNFALGILTCLGDNKASVRTAALKCLNSWMDNCPLRNLLGEIFHVLTFDNPFLRRTVFEWLAEKLPTVTSLPNGELNLCVPVLLGCLQDRNPEVRKKASQCILPFMMHVGYDSMIKSACKHKPASKIYIISHLEKARQNLPKKPTKKQNRTKSVSPLTQRSVSPQVTGNAVGVKDNLDSSSPISKIVSALKEMTIQEMDKSSMLVVNNLKDQRMADDECLNTLKWNFFNPSEVFHAQLKEEMAIASWSKILISHCFHADYKYHIIALDLLIETLETSVDASVANLDLILKWLTLRIFDGIPSVFIKILEYLQVLFQKLSDVEYKVLEFEASAFIPYLIMKMSDLKDVDRKAIREVLKLISRTYPPTKVFSYIMQGLGSKNSRQRAACFEELVSMIELYGLNICQPSPNIAFKEIVQRVSDPIIGNEPANCFVQSYFIEMGNVYQYFDGFADKDMSRTEERIEHIVQSRTVRSSGFVPTATAAALSPSAYLNTTLIEEEQSMFQNTITQSQIFGTLGLQHTDHTSAIPDHLKASAGDDIYMPPTRIEHSASFLELLKKSVEANIAVNLLMNQLAAQEIPVVVGAFSQVKEVLKQNEQAVAIFEARVDQLLEIGTMHYRDLITRYMYDENVSKADVTRLYRSVTVALITLFDNPVLAKTASRDILRNLILHLITVMIDAKMHDLQERAKIKKAINVLVMRILQNSNSTHVLSALLQLLLVCISSESVPDTFTNLVMRSIWRIIPLIRDSDSELNIDIILSDAHVFLKTFPSSSWQDREDDTPIRTVKTILYHLVEIEDEDIMEHLSLIPDIQNSNLVNSLNKFLAKKKNGNRTHKKLGLRDKSQQRRKPPRLRLLNHAHESLTEIFHKIERKEQADEGISELYEFIQKYPEADIEPYLKDSSDFFRDYVYQGIKDLTQRRSPDFLAATSPKSDDWSLISSENESPYRNLTCSQSAQERSPTAFDGIIDLGQLIMSAADRLEMVTLQYDNPDFL